MLDRFRILGPLGRGGMGVVYRAWDERLEREVALKEVSGAPAERVRREAQAAARLSHPGIVTLYELGHDGDRALLVSELVEGRTLEELRSSGEMSDRDVARYGREVADALAHAHSRGVIHRDIKPHNVIVREDEGSGPHAKLMDFGVASLAGAEALTRSGDVVGTLAYMPPEQASGEEAGEAADVYSLALTLLTCWTGRNPVARANPAATARTIGRRVPSLGRLRPDLPEQLVATIDECLSADPAMRPALNDLAAELATASEELDAEEAVPDPSREPQRATPLGRAAGLIAAGLLLGVAGGLALVAEMPGAAVVVALVGLTSLMLAPLPWAALSLAGPLAVLAGAPLAAPALAALAPGPRTRASVAAAACLSAVVVGAVVPIAAVAETAPAGWTESAVVAGQAVAVALASLDVAATLAAWAASAVVLGWALRLPHVLLAAVGALVWAAGASAAEVATGAALGSTMPLVALAVALLIVVAHHRRLPPARAVSARGRRRAEPAAGLDERGARPSLP